MTLRSTLLVALFVLATGEARAQAASTTWALSSGTLMGSSSTGNVAGTNQTISGGSPAMTVFDYTAMGQRLYMGTAGWTAGPEDAMRYVEFNTAPTGGNSFTVSSVTFEYGASNRTTGMSSNVWYSTDGWSTRTQLATNLTYPASGMATFSANTNVTVPPGATFSLRIYPRALLTQLAAAPQFAVHNTVRIAGTTALVLTGTGPFCTTFEAGTSGGWTGNNTGVAQDSTDGNQYIQTTDQSGASYFYNTSPEYTGDWRPLFDDGCGSLCWDVKFVYPGNVFNGQSPPTSMTPSITIEGGGFVASFVASSSIAIGDDWRRVCAPLKLLNPDGTMPSNADGQWVMNVGTPANWATLLSNVTRVRLPTDPSSFQAERFHFDNICIRNTGDCAPPPPPNPGSVCGVKYNDVDGDGIKDPDEVGLPDWTVQLAYTGAAGPDTLTTTTDVGGGYCFGNLTGGVTYTVSEVNQAGWTQTAPAAPGTHTIALMADQDVGGVDFGNRQTPLPTGRICGLKYHDFDGDGTRDLPGDFGLAGWSITLTSSSPATLPQTITTNSAGEYCFEALPAATYTLSETNQTGWTQTAPATPGTHTVALADGQAVFGRDFGNRPTTTTGQCIAPPSGLLGWWSGDGTPNDLTSGAQHGTLVGGATYAPGKVGQAFSLATSADYVSVPNAPNVGTGDFSIDAWIRTTAPTSMIATKTVGTSSVVGYSLYQSSGGLVFMFSDGTASFSGSSTAVPLNDGQWHFVTVTVQRGTPSVIRLYVDGQAPVTLTTLSNNSNNPTGSISNTAPLLLGRSPILPNLGFRGDIDELELFNRVLLPSEVTALYEAGSAGKCKTPPPPPPTGSICGLKYHDLNGNGLQDLPTETGLPGWTISLSFAQATGPVTLTATTDATGAYCFANLAGGVTYTASEVNQTGWTQTAPAAPGTYTVPLSAGENVTGRDFGNRQSSAGVCIAPPMGLIGWWTGDGTANDQTVFGNDGALQGGATYAAGKVGQAFSFASTSDYVSVPNAPALNVGTGDLSIDAWIRTTGSFSMIVNKSGVTSSNNHIGYSFYQASGLLFFGIADGLQSYTTQSYTATGGSLLNDGQWHFVAVTAQRGTPSVFRLYVDGHLVNTSTTPTANPTGSISNTSPQLIGREQSNPGLGFIGQIDELELFNRVLTPTEVTALYEAGSDGKCRADDPTDCATKATTLPVNTGLDHTASMPYALGGNDAFWTITRDADSLRTVPRPAEVVTHVTNVWTPAQPNSRWIAPSQILPATNTLGLDQDDIGLGLYRYALEICVVGEPATSLTFNLSLLADNTARIYLRRPGDTDNTRLLVGSTTGNGFSSATPITVTLPGPFAAGTYVLEVDVQNDGLSPDFTGMNLNGTVTGANLFMQKHTCCNSNGKITGTKFHDANGNGAWNTGTESTLSGVVIQLLQGSTVVATDTTDSAGEYVFDVAPGTYTVREVVPMGYTQTFPTGGTHTVTVGPGGIVPNRDFGNQVIPCIGVGSLWKCKPGVGGRYLELTITNNGSMPVSSISATALTPGVTLTQFNTVAYPVAVGATAVMNFDVTGLAPGAAAQILVSMNGPVDMSGKSEECCRDTLTVVRPGGPGVILQWCPATLYGDLFATLADGTRPPLGGWTVRLIDPAGRSTTAVTDTSGYFLMEGLPMGTYTASVDMRFGWRMVEPSSGSYQLTFREGGTDATGVHFVVSNQTVSSIGDESAVPTEHALHENYPNPFSDETRIRYGLPQPGHVRIEVFDVLGRRVAVLVNGLQPAGHYEAAFDASRLGGGTYIYRMTSGTFVETRRMVLVK